MRGALSLAMADSKDKVSQLFTTAPQFLSIKVRVSRDETWKNLNLTDRTYVFTLVKNIVMEFVNISGLNIFLTRLRSGRHFAVGS
jgi:hypothetical protein